jgi:hypothetical protein
MQYAGEASSIQGFGAFSRDELSATERLLRSLNMNKLSSEDCVVLKGWLSGDCISNDAVASS